MISKDGGEATLLVRITPPFDSSEVTRRAPLDVAFVLDRSGSMSGGKLPLAKEGIDLAVARLRDADRAALVVYDNEVDIIQTLGEATPRLKSHLRLALHGIDPGGSTFLSGGWVAGCQQLAEAPAPSTTAAPATRIRRVILLTDGRANVGIVNPRELATHAGELRQRGIATTTVGVGLDFDEGLLSAMAEAGGGNFQYIANPEELRQFFARELQELFTVAATNLSITLNLPSDVNAELISAFPMDSHPGSLQVTIGDLPASDAIDLVFSLRANDNGASDNLAISISAEWTDVLADARNQIDITAEPLRLVANHVVADTAADPLVAEIAALQRASAERRAALELDRAGRYAESRRRMMMSRMHLESAPRTSAVEASLQESNELAMASEFAPYDSHLRKTTQQREQLRRRGRYNPPSHVSESLT